MNQILVKDYYGEEFIFKGDNEFAVTENGLLCVTKDKKPIAVFADGMWRSVQIIDAAKEENK